MNGLIYHFINSDFTITTLFVFYLVWTLRENHHREKELKKIIQDNQEIIKQAQQVISVELREIKAKLGGFA